MKRYMTIVAVLGALVLAFGVVGVAFADSPINLGQGFGSVGMGRGGGMWNQGAGQEGPLHDAILDSMAAALGIDAAELDERLDGGETMWQVAQSVGLSAEEFTTVLQDARAAAIEQAVAEGTLTQEQADRMAQGSGRGASARGAGMASGVCDGTGTGMGRGASRWSAQSD